MVRRFSYEGDHAEVTLYGVTFPQGEPVAVDAEPLLTKLAGNSHFREHFSHAPELDRQVATMNKLAEMVPSLKRKPGRPRKDV